MSQGLFSSYKKRAYLLIAIPFAVTLLCLAAIVKIQLSSADTQSLIAEIYRDGKLTMSIPLSEVTESYSFTLTSADGGTNQIEVRPDSIGILSADCPDKLCVHQGFIHSSMLPITCLPNHLVIQLRSIQDYDTSVPDAVTY